MALLSIWGPDFEVMTFSFFLANSGDLKGGKINKYDPIVKRL
jgi:hypothetical protein